MLLLTAVGGHRQTVCYSTETNSWVYMLFVWTEKIQTFNFSHCGSLILPACLLRFWNLDIHPDASLQGFWPLCSKDLRWFPAETWTSPSSAEFRLCNSSRAFILDLQFNLPSVFLYAFKSMPLSHICLVTFSICMETDPLTGQRGLLTQRSTATYVILPHMQVFCLYSI